MSLTPAFTQPPPGLDGDIALPPQVVRALGLPPQSSASDQLPAPGERDPFTILRERMGWTEEFLEEINSPLYPPLRDIDTIAHMLHHVRTTGTKIVVLPDFDMDGITSGTLGYAGLAELGFDVELYVPDYRRGHDIAPEAIDELVERHPGVGAIITCDGGVNSHAGIQRGRDLGLLMMVTDHHLQVPTNPDGSATSPAHVLVDPARLDETYPHPGICGAFVLYQVLLHYAATYAPHKHHDVALLRLFAGIGTVSDVMPLQYENRQIVKDSLAVAKLLRHPLPSADKVTPYDVDKSVLMALLNARLAEGDHHPVFVRAFRGFAYVLQSWREVGKFASASDIAADFYAFYLAPAFNALRRVEAPMHIAFDVFTAEDPARQYEAATEIIEVNEKRKEATEHWMAEMATREQPLAPHVWFTDAPTGMLGLLAGKMLHEHEVPVLVVRDPGDCEVMHGGSARAPMWFRVISTLASHGVVALGHEQACGVRAANLAQLAEVAEIFADASAQHLAQIALARAAGELAEPYDLALGLQVEGHAVVDAGLGSTAEMLDLVRRIEAVGPFGHEFPRPLVRLVINLALCSMRTLGSEDTHLKITLPTGMKLLWWNAAENLPDLTELAQSPMPGASIVSFDVEISINRFLGEESPQATVTRAYLPEEI